MDCKLELVAGPRLRRRPGDRVLPRPGRIRAGSRPPGERGSSASCSSRRPARRARSRSARASPTPRRARSGPADRGRRRGRGARGARGSRRRGRRGPGLPLGPVRLLQRPRRQHLGGAADPAAGVRPAHGRGAVAHPLEQGGDVLAALPRLRPPAGSTPRRRRSCSDPRPASSSVRCRRDEPTRCTSTVAWSPAKSSSSMRRAASSMWSSRSAAMPGMAAANSPGGTPRDSASAAASRNPASAAK